MNLLGMGPMELILIVVLALIVFGPAKLPEIMGQVGKAVNDFRRATSDLSDEFNKTIKAELEETRAIVDETKSVVTEARTSMFDAHSSVTSAIAGATAPVRTAVPGEQTTANGISSEPPTNGTIATEAKPPLADTAQWSWETSSTPSAHDEPAAAEPDAIADTPNVEAPPPGESATPETSNAAAIPDIAGPAEPAKSTQERTARDELSPPY